MRCIYCDSKMGRKDNYCAYCGTPAPTARQKARQIAISSLQTIRGALIGVIGGLALVAIVTSVGPVAAYNIPPSIDARQQLSSYAQNTSMENDSRYRPQLITSATYEGEATAYANDINFLLEGMLPKSVDDMLCERGWHITFTDKEYDELIPFVTAAGLTTPIGKTIIISTQSTGIYLRNIVLHEIGHAVDFECGFLSETQEFLDSLSGEYDASTPKGSFVSQLRISDADSSHSQRFAQAFAYYAQYPEYNEDCPAFYDWFSHNIMPPADGTSDEWNLYRVKWRAYNAPEADQLQAIRDAFGSDEEIVAAYDNGEITPDTMNEISCAGLYPNLTESLSRYKEKMSES